MTNVDFGMHRQLSSYLNLIEQMNELEQLISFSSIDLSKAGDNGLSSTVQTSKKSPTLEDMIKSTMQAQAFKELDELNKSDIVETKAMVTAPMAVQKVAEAVCILYAKPASFDNFKKLVNTSPNFINDLKQFDISSVSDFAVTKLDDYVSDANFTTKYISQISRFASALCTWVRYVHATALHNSSLSKPDTAVALETSYSSSTVQSLIALLAQHACFSFSWSLNDPASVGLLSSVDLKNIDSALEQVDLTRAKFLSLDSYFNTCESNQHLSYRAGIFQNHAKAKSCKVRNLLSVYNGATSDTLDGKIENPYKKVANPNKKIRLNDFLRINFRGRKIGSR
jgi:hypothetical protein